MRKYILSALLSVIAALNAWCEDNNLLHNYSYYARVGYNLGGTAPIGMPASIRTLHCYNLCPNFTLGFDAFHPFNDKWGIMFGLHFENKGMDVDAGVKGYHMKMVRGGEQLEGVFTGNVVTKVDQSLATVPIQATFSLNEKLRMKLGPYFSYVTSKKFEGMAYDGYLRRQEEGHPQGDPTGQKVELGHDEGERGEYDFSDDMRNWQFGIAVGADWYITKRWGASVGLTWGVSEVFKKSFTVIEQRMYPIYGTIGVIYQLK